MRPRRESFAQRSGLVRLQKFLSDAGVASRRHAENYIREGRVLVNGHIVDELPAFIDPEKDKVIFNGAPVKVEPLCYVAVNKPRGVVCSNRDPEGRRRVVDLLPAGLPRLFIVGRLDTDSSGLVLMTNDGELAAKITHPSYGVPKVYHVEVRGSAPDTLPATLRRGVYFEDGKASVSDVTIVSRSRERSALQITSTEGRNSQLRAMMLRVGYPVKRLRRTSIGPIDLRDLAVGMCRRLTQKEVDALARMLENPRPRPAGARRPKPKPRPERSQEKRAARPTDSRTKRRIIR